MTGALLVDSALDCGGTGNTPSGGIVYVGGGSVVGEGAMTSSIRQVAPMSRFLDTRPPDFPGYGPICYLPNVPPSPGDGSQSTSEGIIFALDGLSIVASESTGGAESCNGTVGAPCAPGIAKGLAAGNIISVPGYVCPTQTDTQPYWPADPNCVNGLYKILDSQDALRLIYFGLDHDFKDATQRNCGNPNAGSAYLSNPGLVRSALVETWGNLFRDPGNCAGCTRLWRAFRLSDQSGTSEHFVALMGRQALCGLSLTPPCSSVNQVVAIAVPPITQATRSSPFCNSRQTTGVQCGPGQQGGFDNFTHPNNLPHRIGGSAINTRSPADSDPPPPMTAPKSPATTPIVGAWDFPDSAFGFIGSDPWFTDFQDFDCIRRQCAGPFGDVVKEQVCSARGDLGLVLPIWDPPQATVTVDPFPSTPCQSGKFVAVAAPPCNGSAPSLCPNGERPTTSVCPINPGVCLAPALSSGDPRCRNNALNRFTGQRLVDGRVYNLHLHENNTAPHPDHPYATIARRNPNDVIGNVIAAKMVGAFYRIHQTNFLNTPQLNHFVIKGTGNFSAAETTPGGGTAACNPTTLGKVSATRLIGCFARSADPCSVGFAAREASTLPGAEALRVNGFSPDPTCVRNFSYPLSRYLYLDTVKGFENVTGDERKLAECFAQRTIVDAKVLAAGLITRTANSADGTLCRDFDEQTSCSAAVNVNACANNVAPIPQ